MHTVFCFQDDTHYKKTERFVEWWGQYETMETLFFNELSLP